MRRTAGAHRVHHASSAAKLEWDQIARVLLVGGSTRMPMVRRMLEELTGKTPDATIHPDEAVARGAAIYAGFILASRGEAAVAPRFKVVDVNSHSLGIEGIDQQVDRKKNMIIIPRNSPLPAKVTQKFATKTENQRSIIVRVLEGESTVPDHCTVIGRAVLRELPADLPKGWPVQVTYEYGANGRLSVRANVPGTDKQLAIELDREAGLSGQRLSRWKQVVTAESGFDALEKMLEEVLKTDGDANGEPESDSPERIEARDSPSGGREPAGSEHYQRAHTRRSDGIEPKRESAMPSTAESTGRRPRRGPAPLWQSIFKHIVASIVGLAIGYYILCFIRPEWNVLNLPGPPPAEHGP